MEKETYKEIEKIADNLQAAAGRKKCREIERANSYYEGYEQGILESWREKRNCGSGWINHTVSSCGLYEKNDPEALKRCIRGW